MSATKERNSSIDLLKFLFSIVIVFYHFGIRQGVNLLPGGYIMVEGFFMITGYFMMNSVTKTKNSDIFSDTLKFAKHKFLSFFPVLLFSAIIGFFIKIIVEKYSLGNLLVNSVYLLTEIFPLQITGLATVKATGVSWYLSAMMISLILLYPLARANSKRFTHLICPLAVALIYGSLSAEYGQLDIIWPLLPSLPFIRAGLLRSIAGICAGCMLFPLVKATENKNISHFGELFYQGAELLCLAFIAIVAFFIKRSCMDYFTLPFFFILLYINFGKKSFFAKRFSFGFTKHLSTASLLFYLNHNQWNAFIKLIFPDASTAKKLLIYVVLIIVSSIVVYFATRIFDFSAKKLKPFVIKHIIGE